MATSAVRSAVSTGKPQLALAMLLALSASALIARASREEIQYGLDFRGGGQLVFEVEGGGPEDLERACDLVRTRLDDERVRDVGVRCQGSEIEVRLGALDANVLEGLARRIVDSHTLAFQRIDDEADVLRELVTPEGVMREEESVSSPRGATRVTYLVASGPLAEARLASVIASIALPPGRTLAVGEHFPSGSHEPALRTYLLHDVVELGGDSVADASLALDEPMHPAVQVELDRAGSQKFEELTGEMIGKRLAVVLDGRVLMAPMVMGKIGGGSLRIALGSTGSSDDQIQKGSELARSLRSGALPRPLRLSHSLTIEPSVSMRAVERACAVGVAALVAFGAVMGLRHGRAGVLAALSPWLAVLVSAALYLQVGAVVTLPGVLGSLLFGAVTAVTFAALAELHRRSSTKEGPGHGTAPRRWWALFGAAQMVLLLAGAALYAVTHGWWRGFSFGACLGAVASLATTLLLGSAAHARAAHP